MLVTKGRITAARDVAGTVLGAGEAGLLILIGGVIIGAIAAMIAVISKIVWSVRH